MNLIAFIFSSAMAMAAPEAPQTHSSVEAKAVPAGENMRLEFKINAGNGLHVNQDAPWTLELKEAPGLSFSQMKWNKAALDKALPGFSATTTAKPSQTKGVVSYTLTAFVCTDDKKLCYRDILKGELPWQKP